MRGGAAQSKAGKGRKVRKGRRGRKREGELRGRPRGESRLGRAPPPLAPRRGTPCAPPHPAAPTARARAGRTLTRLAGGQVYHQHRGQPEQQRSAPPPPPPSYRSSYASPTGAPPRSAWVTLHPQRATHVWRSLKCLQGRLSPVGRARLLECLRCYLAGESSPEVLAEAPPPPPRTKWTRRVPHPVLIGHAASLPGAGGGAQDAGALPPPPYPSPYASPYRTPPSPPLAQDAGVRPPVPLGM